MRRETPTIAIAVQLAKLVKAIATVASGPKISPGFLTGSSSSSTPQSKSAGIVGARMKAAAAAANFKSFASYIAASWLAGKQ